MKGRHVFSGVAVIALLGALAGCASTSKSTGTDSLEGGVKIPTASAPATGKTTTTVNVTLGDTNGAGPMTLDVSPATAPAGDVKFVVKNNGTIVHEAVVLKTNTPYNKLPITYGGDPPVPTKTNPDKVSEDTNVGETGDPDLEPGGTRTFTIKNMTAGEYAIVCNIAGHYGKGMRAPFTVTRPSTTVNVTLGDTNGAGPMTLDVSPATAPAGDVKFVVKNNGTIVHEAVVLKTNTPYNKLPITYGGDPPVPTKTNPDKVSEDTNVGETGDPDLEPGGTRTFTIKNMTAGEYAIVCNIAGHYGKGMRAPFTVTRPSTTVNVTLGDTNGAGPMTLDVSPATAPAGDVKFVVKNNGTIVHEAVVLKTNTPYNKLPITYGGDPPVPTKTNPDKVSEDTNVGETGDPDLEPGGTRTFTIKNMTAGEYAIVCNIAGHYGKGMRAPFRIG